MSYIRHPIVRAEYDIRVGNEPKMCHYPYGATHFTAQKPNPHFCARPVGHPGVHMDEERYAEHKGKGRERIARFRSKEIDA
jgi:hypothetical protein